MVHDASLSVEKCYATLGVQRVHLPPASRPRADEIAMTLRDYKKLSNAALLDRLDVLLMQTRTNLTELIVCMGEVERRSRFVAAGYSSIHAYCVEVFHVSDDEAFKRIRAAGVHEHAVGLTARR